MLKLKIFVLFALAIQTLSATVQVDKNKTISIIAGFLEGIVEQDHLSDLQECLQDSEELTEQLEEIQNDLESRNINAMFDGLKLIGKLVLSLPSQLKDCEKIKDDLEQFKKWAEVFTKPQELYVQLMKNIPAHFTEIWDDIQDANTQYQNGDYYKYGKDLGDSMVLAVGQVQTRYKIVEKLDQGYQKFKEWFDEYIWSSQEKREKSLTEEIIQGISNTNLIK
ncbi:UNKNOWN [Stylonychia lemnae]|uniref:Uncharacterized protein n=1 Tax=Stylonychia lemnae TaxID=5949 RepID=A0A077ZWR8_STYLE|nr:UNKNOWN [Stylonychia lemnae]|eukprot:CDW72936.1 UNKNOWN [Stylonychia lemnae]